jgi:plastocyanin
MTSTTRPTARAVRKASRASGFSCAFAFSLALGVTALLSCPLAIAQAATAVDIAKFAFSPKEITVEPGTRVRWINRDETPHTVTSQSARRVFSSPGLDLDDHYEFAFAEEGDFPYFCTVHPMMTGVVHVRKSAGKP